MDRFKFAVRISCSFCAKLTSLFLSWILIFVSSFSYSFWAVCFCSVIYRSRSVFALTAVSWSCKRNKSLLLVSSAVRSLAALVSVSDPAPGCWPKLLVKSTAPRVRDRAFTPGTALSRTCSGPRTDLSASSIRAAPATIVVTSRWKPVVNTNVSSPSCLNALAFSTPTCLASSLNASSAALAVCPDACKFCICFLMDGSK